MPLYKYEDMHSKQFEYLVVLISRKLFGIAVQSFTEGPDGGRDAKFHGMAEIFPSTASPWLGKTIIQAKHSAGYGTSFSDSSFFNIDSESCVINKELGRIKQLKETSDLDNYILFSNRKLTGNAGTKITLYIHQKTGIPETNIHLVGLNDIDSYLSKFTDIHDNLEFKISDAPLTVDPSDLAELIEHLSETLPNITNQIEDSPVKRTSYADKNRINNMSDPFAKHLKKQFLAETSIIQNYLTHPSNITYRDLYLQIVEEFQRKIISRRDSFDKFDHVYNYLVEMIIERSPYISQRENRKLMKAMLFFMYFNCDLGESDDSAD
ncbi:hypothetical protein F906_01538 [Acinetobacter pseudolwoffii]|uniref:ABC-three component systems C-terminal domain-containing protein n=1 Tax=Acinetobacter pseudolwoffii TaxID=2053287 RepID=N9KR85_9GAMM|nr:ABC-three component system protein [Acinetobacter pseudolwoffii]ENW86483.1 hypothetical protein F906_01538 [Acinetobacter pseudolwoffii]